MAILSGLARIGRDAEVRHTQGGDAVCSLSLAFAYGKKGADGKRPTQWVDASIWGKRAENLAPYLLKGQQVAVTLNDVHIETYQGKNGEASKLSGNITEIDFAGDRPAAQAAALAAKPAPRPAQKRDEFDDDIPF